MLSEQHGLSSCKSCWCCNEPKLQVMNGIDVVFVLSKASAAVHRCISQCNKAVNSFGAGVHLFAGFLWYRVCLPCSVDGLMLVTTTVFAACCS